MEAVEEKKITGLDDKLFLFEDVLVKILSKLPVKSILRFRCVCKRWLYIISEDPLLIQLHSHQSKSKPQLVFISDPSDKFDETWVISSSDMEGNPISRFEFKVGSQCFPQLLPTNFDLVCIYDSETIRICNPSTHELITVPLPPFNHAPQISFGYVESTQEYKLVCLISPDYYHIVNLVRPASFNSNCQVFTLGSSTSSSSSSPSNSSWAWRDVMNSPRHIYGGKPAFVNGALHWLVFHSARYSVFDPENTIVAFDVESEEFRLLPHPKGFPDLRSISRHNEHLNLVELRGLLCLSHSEKYSQLDIWMLKDYENGTWIKEYSIDWNLIANGASCDEWIHLPVFTARDMDDTKVLIEIQFSSHGTMLGYYHLQSKSFKKFIHCKEKQVLGLGKSTKFSFYVESLCSLEQLQVKASIEAEAKA